MSTSSVFLSFMYQVIRIWHEVMTRELYNRLCPEEQSWDNQESEKSEGETESEEGMQKRPREEI